MKFYQKLSFKIISGVFLILFLSSSLLVFNGYRDFRLGVSDLKEDMLIESGKNLAQLFENEIIGQKNIAENLSKMEDLQLVLQDQNQTDRINNFLEIIKNANQEIMGIRLIDKHGEIIATSDSGMGTSLAEREYFKTAIDGKSNISEVTISTVTGKMFYTIATPIEDNRNNVIGVLSVAIDWESLINKVVNFDGEQSGHLFVVDANGTLYC